IMLDPKLEGIDDYLAAVDKFAETHIKSADNVFRDPMGAINQDSFDAVEGVSNIRKAWETVDGLDETESAMFATWRAAHDETVNSHKSILNKLQSAAPAELRASDIVEAETKLYEQGATTLKGVYDGHWDKFFGLSDEKAGFSSWSSFAKSRLGLDIPVDVDVKEAKNLIAREIKKQQTEAWGKHFDTFYDGVQNSFDRIIGSVSEDFQKELTEGFELAKNRRVTAAKIRDAVF
ncbi:MAG: hypothetical protein GY755_11385, partial [Chloroflexi bacterium]|nr:hypothetical protein [Chloroflexota bacterium]